MNNNFKRVKSPKGCTSSEPELSYNNQKNATDFSVFLFLIFPLRLLVRICIYIRTRKVLHKSESHPRRSNSKLFIG